MSHQYDVADQLLSGRIHTGPSSLLHAEILEPQFRYELHHLLRWYILIEKVSLLEYERMGLLGRAAVSRIGALLGDITPETLVADPDTNMSDIAFAIEQYVEQRLDIDAYSWHIDRSRNDFQACAQLMFGRDQMFEIVQDLLVFVRAVHRLAEQNVETIMPGYTHYQAAQVITVGFYLTALCENVIGTLHQLAAIYQNIDKCPLGAGAMAGQHLPWDRRRMARLLGFKSSQRHALVSVATRDWVLRIAGELSAFSTILSRFVTDLLTWSDSEHQFFELPDELSGISSSMPQKKNFPIFERIRGKTSHILAFYLDFCCGQRNTPYTNLVEVSKEASSYLLALFSTTRSILRLFTAAIEHMVFHADHMRSMCVHAYLGCFTLANLLTLHTAIPYRTAQVIVGRYAVMAIERRVNDCRIDIALLQQICRGYGQEVHLLPLQEQLQAAWDVDSGLSAKRSAGSTNPAAVREIIALQKKEIDRLDSAWAARRMRVERAYGLLHELVTHGIERAES